MLQTVDTGARIMHAAATWPITYATHPCSNGCAFISMNHKLRRFSAISSVTLYPFMYFRMLSIHLLLGLPLLLFSCTCIFLVLSSLSFLYMLSYHRSQICLRNVVIVSMLSSIQISSFLMWYFFVVPLTHLTILMSVVCSFFW